MRRHPGTLGVVIATVALLVATVVLTVAWATKERRFVASAPQPPPLYETEFVTIHGGDSACMEEATSTPRGNLVQIRVSTNGRPPEPLSIRVTDMGSYTTTGEFPRRYRDNDVLSARIKPPPRPLHTRVCIKNEGNAPVDIFAAGDESPTLDAAIFDPRGRDIDYIPVIRFLESDRTTIAANATDIADEITVFRPPWVVTWLLWPLAVLLVVGLPLGIGVSLWRGSAGDRD